ncbi:MAG: penicillin-binding protein 2 [Brevinemataceae bacterium]
MQDIKHIPVNRLVYITGILILIFLTFFSRLFYLQLLKGNIFKNQAQKNQTRRLRIPAYRSIIFDRNKILKLTYNERSLALTLIPANIPSQQPQRNILLTKIATILSISTEQLENIIKEQFIDAYTPIVLDDKPTMAEISQFAERIDEFPGIFWENRPKRVYPFGEAGFHVIGYTGLLNKAEYDSLKHLPEYYLGASMGKRGIEKQYDPIIRGNSGILIRSVNVMGQVLEQEISKEPIQGNHIVLTIDARLQQKAYDLLKDFIGAIVVTHVSTGEILALVSSPSLDPTIFNNSPNSQQAFREHVLDPRHPFLNRTIQGKYPPASTFKLITTAAFLKAGIDPNKELATTGFYPIGNRVFKDWKNHGIVDMRRAIGVSANVYFYHHSQTVGRKAIFEMAREFGFTTPYQIDLPDENSGFLPNDNWFQKIHKRRWSNGDTANIAIGQGDVLATPLEINMMTVAIANNGIIYKPYILKEILNIRDKNTIWSQTPVPLKTIALSPEAFKIIQEGMAQTVEAHGTAGVLTRYKSIKVPIAAKSGTAQTGFVNKENGLFTGYGPYGNENLSNTIAITVLLENQRTGIARSIMVELFNYYFMTLYPDANPNNNKTK